VSDPESRPQDMTALELLEELWGLDHALDQASLRMLREVGVTGPQRVALRLLTLRGDIGPSELARQMHLHPATITSLLGRLERNGYVQRLPSREDRRRTILIVTEAGRTLGESKGAIEAAVEVVLRQTDPEDLAACVRVLGALTDALAPLGEDSSS
jgi:DNA-binding MarR family transcriptional regulator